MSKQRAMMRLAQFKRRHLVGVLIAAAVLASSSTVWAGFIKTGDFVAANSLPGWLATGDMNRDGWQDVVMLGFSSNSVFVLNGDGAGQLGPAAEYATGQIGSNPQSLVLTDLNGDLYLDMVVGEFLNDKLTFFFNQADGTFGAPTAESISGQVRPRGLAADDLDGDGMADLVVNYFDGRFHGGDFAVWKNDGSGSFPESSRTQIGAGGSIRVVLEDFDGDNELDAVVTTLHGNIGIAKGNGDGTFQSFSLIGTGALDESLDIDVGYFNGDGNLDLVVTDRFGPPRMMFGTGSGSFTAGGFVPVPFNAGRIASGDFDNNGYWDLVASRHDDNGDALNMIDVFLNDGSGSMTLSDSLLLPSGSGPMALTDFNNDGLLDIAAASEGGHVTVFLNTAAVPEPGGLLLGTLGIFVLGLCGRRRHCLSPSD
jgi:hypothetical protein